MKTTSVRTRIKFCGFTRAGDVRLACELGVDAIGLVFAEGSPRKLQVEEARALRQGVMPLVSVVALFMDNPPEQAREVVRILRPNVLQFHGNEDDSFCRSFGLPYIKAIPMGEGGGIDPLAMHARWPHASAFLFDGHIAGGQGGSGRTFDWARLPADSTKPVMVAGGLSIDNVHGLVTTRAPWAVDVASAIESAPGIKDGDKMRKFVAEVHRADCENEHESGYRWPTPGGCG
ncbi:phosphoribosylanthranilate isomerase [Lysobacter pythonis]|uniref:N-(5'-phosphoribosyl)anthranilate isomerase n=1 Tax=Solilutibacter pythonis TaxID=2483112 RepID=A0A3M2I4M6_9GAMM|nr:phosphoribosylanthranilate isomerase [Lysobacter pythonis]RMH94980.1 phosphoribosylanthranilate isomerase [Lysobacter pythonis]